MNVVLWALATGLITGAVFATIILVGSRRREGELRAALEARDDELEAARAQMAELEERVQFTERLLTQQHSDQRLPPPDR
jgi:hypothetical protein